MLWTHEEPVTKAKRTTDSAGAVNTITELDPWGAETTRSYWSGLLSHRYTSYERDANGDDEAMHRRYNRLSRFDQPDPADFSYDLSNPQSFNRYSYTQNDPVNFVDPSGLYFCFDPDLGVLPGGFYDCDGSRSGIGRGGRIIDDPKPGGGGSGFDHLFGDVPPPAQQEQDPCTPQFREFFSNLDLYKQVAKSLNTKVEFVLAHSSWESGYFGPHSRELHNLFGLTDAGGKNLNFDSYQEGANKYVETLKSKSKVFAPSPFFNVNLFGAPTIEDFTRGLRQAHFNTLNPDYSRIISDQLQYVIQHAKDCGVTL